MNALIDVEREVKNLMDLLLEGAVRTEKGNLAAIVSEFRMSEEALTQYLRLLENLIKASDRLKAASNDLRVAFPNEIIQAYLQVEYVRLKFNVLRSINQDRLPQLKKHCAAWSASDDAIDVSLIVAENKAFGCIKEVELLYEATITIDSKARVTAPATAVEIVKFRLNAVHGMIYFLDYYVKEILDIKYFWYVVYGQFDDIRNMNNGFSIRNLHRMGSMSLAIFEIEEATDETFCKYKIYTISGEDKANQKYLI